MTADEMTTDETITDAAAKLEETMEAERETVGVTETDAEDGKEPAEDDADKSDDDEEEEDEEEEDDDSEEEEEDDDDEEDEDAPVEETASA